MIIVRVIGGLGNQIFQYAFYMYLKTKYNDVKADISDFERYKLHNGFMLQKVFGIELDIVNEKEIRNIKDLAFSTNKYYLAKARNKLLGKKKSHIFENEFKFNIIKELRDVYLSGYWHNLKYIRNISNSLKDNLKFNISLNQVNKNILDNIQDFNSISIHVRRGDYLKNKNYNVLNSKYYLDAINNISKIIHKPIFYVFSDDMAWTKKNICGENVRYITENIGADSYIDMFLMKKCKHNIIANSTFSWWAAYLNNNPNKIVILPKTWYNDYYKNKRILYKLIPDNWIPLE